jgi:hypothetical protein
MIHSVLDFVDFDPDTGELPNRRMTGQTRPIFSWAKQKRRPPSNAQRAAWVV